MKLTTQTKRRLAYGGNAILVTIIMAGILIGLNFMAYRYSYRMDLTQNKLFSLSDQSRNIVKNLKSDVVMTAFMPESFKSYEESKQIEFIKDLLDEYDNLSSKVKVVHVNPNKEPQLAKDAGIRFLPALSIDVNGLNKVIYGSKIDEQNITATLVKMTRDKINTIGFLDGKGGNNKDLTVLKSVLNNEGYKVENFNINSKKDLSEYSVVIIAGPRDVFSDSEKFVIDKYIYNGGKVLFALDPMFNTGLEELLDSYGVKVADDYIIDEKSYMWDLFRGKFYHWPIILNFVDSQIVRNFTSVLLPLVRSLSLDKNISKDIETEELMKTTDQSWDETDTKSGTAQFTEGVDQKGPFTVAISLMGKFKSFYKDKGIQASSNTNGQEATSIDTSSISDDVQLVISGENKKARIIVVGDSDFMTDQHIRQNYNNGDFILNSISWLTEDEDLISIHPKKADDRRINPMSETMQNLIFWGNVLGMSILVLLYGLIRYLLIKKSRKKVL